MIAPPPIVLGTAHSVLNTYIIPCVDVPSCSFSGVDAQNREKPTKETFGNEARLACVHMLQSNETECSENKIITIFESEVGPGVVQFVTQQTLS